MQLLEQADLLPHTKIVQLRTVSSTGVGLCPVFFFFFFVCAGFATVVAVVVVDFPWFWFLTINKISRCCVAHLLPVSSADIYQEGSSARVDCKCGWVG